MIRTGKKIGLLATYLPANVSTKFPQKPNISNKKHDISFAFPLYPKSIISRQPGFREHIFSRHVDHTSYDMGL